MSCPAELDVPKESDALSQPKSVDHGNQEDSNEGSRINLKTYFEEKRKKKLEAKKKKNEELYKNHLQDYSFTKICIPSEELASDLSTVLRKSEVSDIVDHESKSDDVQNVDQEEKKLAQLTLTENGAPAFNTTDDVRLDFFFQVKENTGADLILKLLEKSWAQHPLDTLKLVAHLRDIREGKGVRVPYFHSLYWMYEHHPLTLFNNLQNFQEIGYWKDLSILLLMIAFHGYLPEYLMRDDDPAPKSRTNIRTHAQVEIPKTWGRKGQFVQAHNFNEMVATHFDLSVKDKASLSSHEWKELRIRFARDRFLQDAKYRQFHMKIAQLFAVQLQNDYEILSKAKDKSELSDISLAAKWAPSLMGHVDRYTLLATSIGLDVINRRQDLSWILEKHPAVAACLARKHLHKEYYRPLRDATEVPEVHMHRDEWQLIKYQRVASKCMKKNKELFLKYDEERFKEFIDSRKKVSGAALKPVEIVAEMLDYVVREAFDIIEDSAIIEIQRSTAESDNTRAKIDILEKQWISLCEDVCKKGGLLERVVSICDVSGSMNGTPMQAAIALTLLACQLSNEPWSKLCITFSEQPELWEMDPNASLYEKVKNLKNMKWGYNTNLQAVFTLILEMAKNNNLTQDDMPKLVAVFTDMEFDSAFEGDNSTNFEVAKAAFEEAGYNIPPILFWNLRGAAEARSCPVQKDERGTVLLSGYSGQLLAQIMGAKNFDQMTPLGLMLGIISSKAYDKFQVFD